MYRVFHMVTYLLNDIFNPLCRCCCLQRTGPCVTYTEGRQADCDDQRVRRDVRGGSKADPECPGRKNHPTDSRE